MAGQPNPYPPPPPGAQQYGFGPPGAPPPPPPPGEWQPAKSTSGKAVGSLVCAGIGLVACPPVLLVGMVLGVLGIAETGRQSERSGRGLAITGTALSVLFLAGYIAIYVFVFALAFQGVEEAQRHQVEGVDEDVALIVERMKQYCAQNMGTLHPGGPVLSPDPDEPVAFSNHPDNAPPGNESTPGRVAGKLEVRHLVATRELKLAGMCDYQLTVTGATTATLVVKFRFRMDGQTTHEYDIKDASKGLWSERYR